MKNILLSIASVLSVLIIAPTPAFALFTVGQGGTGASSFAFGQLLFGNGTNPIGTSASLAYSTSTETLMVETLLGPLNIALVGNVGSGDGQGGDVTVEAGQGGDTGNGGSADVTGGDGGPNGGNGGSVLIRAGTPQGGNNNSGGDIVITGGDGLAVNSSGGNVSIRSGSKTGSGEIGVIQFSSGGANRLFKFPNFSGVFGLVEADQTWTGTNTFNKGASATTTVNFGMIGDATSRACFNTKDAATGGDVSFYIANGAIVVENNLCR
jgi:hypothetical protein